MFELALKLKWPSVAFGLAHISSRELTAWQAFFNAKYGDPEKQPPETEPDDDVEIDPEDDEREQAIEREVEEIARRMTDGGIE